MTDTVVKSEISVITRNGDDKIFWDKNQPQEVERARGHFEKALSQGYAAFKTNRDFQKGEQIKEFDPEAEAILMTPPNVAG